ncbi:hypothetical protein ALP06_03438 [Pseudomonas coronafaciens pv. atropurpurea]|nr:hypothetical protein ALP06_03438 [Pseudomonas coronafaciens pv. atropurpurea]
MVQRYKIGTVLVRQYTFGVLSDGNISQNSFRHLEGFDPQNRLANRRIYRHGLNCGLMIQAFFAETIRFFVTLGFFW